MASSYRSYSRSSSSSIENLPPRTLARVAREIRDLHKTPPEGVRVVLDSETDGSLGEVVAEIEGPTGTPFENKYFQLKLVLSADFPASPPRGHFLTKIFHPNVDNSNGSICVNTLKKDWTPDTTFAHILSVIRCLLIVPFPESSLNDEAGKLFMESYDEYAKRAKLMANIHGRAKPTTVYKTEDGKQEEENEQPTLTDKCSAGELPAASSLGSSAAMDSVARSTLKTVNRTGSPSKGAKGAADKKASKKKSLRRL